MRAPIRRRRQTLRLAVVADAPELADLEREAFRSYYAPYRFDEEAKDGARVITTATELGIDEISMERTLREIAADPFTEFLLAVWAVE